MAHYDQEIFLASLTVRYHAATGTQWRSFAASEAVTAYLAQ